MSMQLVAVDLDRIELPVRASLFGWDTIEVATQANITLRNALSDGAGYEIEVVYDDVLRRFVAESVMVSRSGPGREITARLVRELTIQEIIADVALSEMTMLWDFDEEGPVRKMSGSEALAQILPAAGRESGDVLKDAVLINVLAKLGNWPPLVTIAERLQVSHSTAKRLVARAKEQSLAFFSEDEQAEPDDSEIANG